MTATPDYLLAQSLLLGLLPSRRSLTSAPLLPTTRRFRAYIHRTMPFEFVADATTKFLSLWGAAIDWTFSPYDASLPELTTNSDTDAYLFWMDWRLYRDRMSPRATIDWFQSCLQRLRAVSAAPILVLQWPFHPDPWLQSIAAELPSASSVVDCHLIDANSLGSEIAADPFDDRNDRAAHYPFSDRFTIAAARLLANGFLPALLAPPLKAIALDLDATLYEGVLLEDGVEGVKLTDGHRRFQEDLRRLKEAGFLLTLCSRNEPADVDELFRRRTDFPLRHDDFIAAAVNWQPKWENILTLARSLQLDPSAFLMIDDNPSELLETMARLPNCRVLPADPTGATTCDRLHHYPGVFRLTRDTTAALRMADLRATAGRELMRESANDERSYLASLQMKLRVKVNERSHAERVYDLSQRTNQFNLCLARLTRSEVEQAFGAGWQTTTFELADVLADSGIVGAIVWRIDGESAELIEFTVSCRALGRGAETEAFRVSLDSLQKSGVRRVRINPVEGPRNQPALEWRKRIAETATEFEILELIERVRSISRPDLFQMEIFHES